MRRQEGWHEASILIVDDENDVVELFRQQFRREVRQGLYVLHFAYSAEEALEKLAAGIRPPLIVILTLICRARTGWCCSARSRSGGPNCRS
jgi:CheY-like chemotaxis protein